METLDKKKVVFVCEECGNVKPFDCWQVPTLKARREMVDGNPNIKFVKTVCPSCLKKKGKGG